MDVRACLEESELGQVASCRDGAMRRCEMLGVATRYVGGGGGEGCCDAVLQKREKENKARRGEGKHCCSGGVWGRLPYNMVGDSNPAAATYALNANRVIAIEG